MVSRIRELALCGRLLTPEGLLEEGALLVKEGIIAYAGPLCAAPSAAYTPVEGILAPGFVDIHCHAAGQVFAHESPTRVAEYHLGHGTTGLVLTLYRDLPQARMLQGLLDIKAAMGPGSSILGAHLEGPYLNPRYGTGRGDGTVTVCPEDYVPLADTGVVRQWTCAPEVAGIEAFISYITGRGIVAAIGHSEASPGQVFAARAAGASLVTHLFDATGCSHPVTRWAGTLETDFSTAALVCDGLYYELICDRRGIHVRLEMVKLAIRAAGMDKLVAITDHYVGPEDGSDVNLVGDDLAGSKLTMDQVARNLLALGLSIPEVFMLTSQNPARVLGLSHSLGALQPGCRGDVLLVDDALNLKKVWKAEV